MADMSPTPSDSRSLRLAGLISGGGRTLLNVQDLIERGQLPAQLSLVLASRPCPGVERLRARGVTVDLIPAEARVRPAALSAAITERLDQAQPDLVVMAGFLSLWLIPENYYGRVMNIHPALLPSFGGQGMYGQRVHEAVLGRGCKVSGCTVHFVNNRYDEGPIIVQRAVEVAEDDTAETLAQRVFEQECIAYPEAISLYAQGRLEIHGQRVRIGQ